MHLHEMQVVETSLSYSFISLEADMLTIVINDKEEDLLIDEDEGYKKQ